MTGRRGRPPLPIPYPDTARAATLRKAHAQFEVWRRMGRRAPESLLPLEREYQLWRKRVREQEAYAASVEAWRAEHEATLREQQERVVRQLVALVAEACRAA